MIHELPAAELNRHVAAAQRSRAAMLIFKLLAMVAAVIIGTLLVQSVTGSLMQIAGEQPSCIGVPRR